MTERLSEAARIAGLDPKDVDMALLVGALANLKKWSDAEVRIKKRGGVSMCDEWRENGQALLDASSFRLAAQR